MLSAVRFEIEGIGLVVWGDVCFCGFAAFLRGFRVALAFEPCPKEAISLAGS